ncbi:hypothetical protein J3R30DRAFT_671994 [Lentinula aciculospora]|uniref:Uncharacterized protein n=1 Tax=Lentinula aciculospora TaxID=153920 RepID=A0A9W9DLC9_9AGAR|nr:hypothetical protein J3R30DRAFT_671994 [Lentinula aciculospora]
MTRLAFQQQRLFDFSEPFQDYKLSSPSRSWSLSHAPTSTTIHMKDHSSSCRQMMTWYLNSARIFEDFMRPSLNSSPSLGSGFADVLSYDARTTRFDPTSCFVSMMRLNIVLHPHSPRLNGSKSSPRFVVHIVKDHYQVKIFGICFRNRIVFSALGGACGNDGGWELGPTKIQFTVPREKVSNAGRELAPLTL